MIKKVWEVLYPTILLRSQNTHECTKKLWGDFPGGPVVKNPPSNVGNVGSIPGQETKIPHVVGQLSPHTTTTELVCSGARPLQLEKPTRCNEEPSRHNEDPEQPKF